jgi:hypothetical protein
VEDADGVVSEPAIMPLLASYERQAERFLGFVKDGSAPPVDAAEGARSVRLADAIRRGAA